MLYKLNYIIRDTHMNKRIRKIVTSLLVRSVKRACVSAVTKYRLTMCIHIYYTMLSAGSSLLCFTYDTYLYTCLLLNKFCISYRNYSLLNYTR